MAEEQESRQVSDDVDDFQRGQSMGHAYRKWRKKKNGEDDESESTDDQSSQESESGDESAGQEGTQPSTETNDQPASEGAGENPGAQPHGEPRVDTNVADGAKQGGTETSGEAVGEGTGEAVGEGVGEAVGEGVGEAVGEGIGEAAVEGGILAAGAEAAPETAGATLLGAVALDVGIEGAKVWWKNKWVITLIVICLIAAPFVLGGSLYSYIGKMFFTGSMTKEEKTVFDELSSTVDTGSLTLEDKADLEVMKKGIGNVQAIAMMLGLSEKHPGITVNYLDSSSTSTKKNQPFEFDVTKVDKIKCTDSATRKAYKEFDISLKQDTNWNAYTTSAANIICAPDYYPIIETPIQGAYWSDYGMKEFPLNQASTFAPQVINYKQAQVLDDMIEVSKTAQEELKLKKLVNPDRVTVTESFKSTMPATLSAKLREAYGDPTLSSIRTFAATDEVTGIHISYLG